MDIHLTEKKFNLLNASQLIKKSSDPTAFMAEALGIPKEDMPKDPQGLAQKAMEVKDIGDGIVSKFLPAVVYEEIPWEIQRQSEAVQALQAHAPGKELTKKLEQAEAQVAALELYHKHMVVYTEGNPEIAGRLRNRPQTFVEQAQQIQALKQALSELQERHL